MVARKSLATLEVSVSENDATVVVKLTPEGTENVVGVPERTSASFTVPADVVVAVPGPRGTSEDVTPTGKKPPALYVCWPRAMDSRSLLPVVSPLTPQPSP